MDPVAEFEGPHVEDLDAHFAGVVPDLRVEEGARVGAGDGVDVSVEEGVEGCGGGGGGGGEGGVLGRAAACCGVCGVSYSVGGRGLVCFLDWVWKEWRSWRGQGLGRFDVGKSLGFADSDLGRRWGKGTYEKKDERRVPSPGMPGPPLK